MLTHSAQRRGSLSLMMLGVRVLVLASCSDYPTSPMVQIDCTEAAKVVIPVIDARQRVTDGFDGETRQQLILGLRQLESALRLCDGTEVQTHISTIERILAPFDAHPFGDQSQDVSAIHLALGAVNEVLLDPSM
jgi:hypothetical protein